MEGVCHITTEVFLFGGRICSIPIVKNIWFGKMLGRVILRIIWKHERFLGSFDVGPWGRRGCGSDRQMVDLTRLPGCKARRPSECSGGWLPVSQEEPSLSGNYLTITAKVVKGKKAKQHKCFSATIGMQLDISCTIYWRAVSFAHPKFSKWIKTLYENNLFSRF